MARRSTIANKWFLKCFSAVLVVLVLLDIVLYFVFRSYYYSSVESILRGEANVISTVLTRYYTGAGGSTGYSGEIRRTIEGFNKKDRMELMMINEEGRVTITSSGFAPATVYEMPDYETALMSENGTGSYNG